SCRTRAIYEDSLTQRPMSVACPMRLFWPNADSRLAHSGVHRRSNLADLYRPVPNPDHSRGLIGSAGRNSGGPDDVDFRTGPWRWPGCRTGLPEVPPASWWPCRQDGGRACWSGCVGEGADPLNAVTMSWCPRPGGLDLQVPPTCPLCAVSLYG